MIRRNEGRTPDVGFLVVGLRAVPSFGRLRKSVQNEAKLKWMAKVTELLKLHISDIKPEVKVRKVPSSASYAVRPLRKAPHRCALILAQW